jgi:predicted nuclease with TOPRIM domain
MNWETEQAMKGVQDAVNELSKLSAENLRLERENSELRGRIQELERETVRQLIEAQEKRDARRFTTLCDRLDEAIAAVGFLSELIQADYPDEEDEGEPDTSTGSRSVSEEDAE